MKRKSNEKAIEIQLQDLVDRVVLEPEQKELAIRGINGILHASKVKNLDALEKAINRFLAIVLRANVRLDD